MATTMQVNVTGNVVGIAQGIQTLPASQAQELVNRGVAQLLSPLPQPSSPMGYDPIAGIADAATMAALGASGVGKLSLGARRPAPSDNGALGFVNGSLWRTDGGDIYQASGVTSTDATWTLLPRVAGGVADALPGVQFSGGTVRTNAAYTGHAVDISVTIASTPTAASIDYYSNGELNEQQVQALASRADAGTLILVTKIYDNSGSGNHAVIQSPQLGMILQWSPILKRYAIYGDRSGKYFLTLPITVAANSHNFSLSVIGEGSSSDDGGYSCLGQIGAAGNITGGSAGAMRPQTYGGFVSTRIIGAGSLGGSVAPATNVPVIATPQVSIVSGGASFVISCNEYTATVANGFASAAITGGFIGGDGVTQGFYPMVPFLQFVVTNAALTATQTLAVKQLAYNLLGAYPQCRDVVVIDGDSRTQYTNTTTQDNVSRRIAEYLAGWATVVNVGMGNQTTQTRISQGIPAAIATLSLGGKLIVNIPALGVNQFVVNMESVPTALANLIGYYAALKSVGISKLAITAELVTSNATGSANTNVPLLRAAMISTGKSGLGVDSISDVSGNAAVSNIGNYPDGLHPNSLVHQINADGLRAFNRAALGLFQ